MRTLSFGTWLRRTLQGLSVSGASAPYALAKELPENPRLLEPLCLYAAAALEPERRNRLLSRYPLLAHEFDTHSFLALSGQALEAAMQQIPDSSNPYLKTWKSYLYVRDRKQAEAHTKALIHRKIRRLQEEKQISNYRLYTDLHLNPGNLNAYLHNQDCSKLSLETARRTLHYLETIPV